MFFELAKPAIEKVEKYMQKVIDAEPKGIYGMLLPYIMRGGKRMRPMLAILCCRAAGGNTEKVIVPAAILELFHNFSLIHDDIVDDSQFRRGEPTLHVSHGVPIALNSGDALYTLVWRELMHLELPAKKRTEILKMFVDTFKKVVEGQGTELYWEQQKRFDIEEEEYLSMIDGKTSSLIGFSCELGAMIGSADKPTCARLKRFGLMIGAAFQIHDDVLNVTGTFEKYKKEIGGDITEGKRTLMVVHCLKNSDEETKKKIIEILLTHSRNPADINFVINAMEKAGSIKYAREKAIRLIDQAETELSKLKPSEARDALMAVCDYMASRES